MVQYYVFESADDFGSLSSIYFFSGNPKTRRTPIWKNFVQDFVGNTVEIARLSSRSYAFNCITFTNTCEKIKVTRLECNMTYDLDCIDIDDFPAMVCRNLHSWAEQPITQEWDSAEIFFILCRKICKKNLTYKASLLLKQSGSDCI